MNNNNDILSRNIFQERIRKGLLGPGSDIFVDNKDMSDEIISDYPLQRYYTGILFPDKERVKTLEEQADNEVVNVISNESDDKEPIENKMVEDKEFRSKNTPCSKKDQNEDDELKISQNTFFPSNIGLTFCIDSKETEIEAEFSFGLYSLISKNIKIKISQNIFDDLINHPTFPFKEIIYYQNGHMILKRKLEGKSKQPRTGEFAQLDAFKKSDEFKDSSIKYGFHYFEKLIGRTWSRENIIEKRIIPVFDVLKPLIIIEKNITKESIFSAAYTLKTYSIPQNPNNTYVKIQLINTSDKHPAKKFSNSNEKLNAKSIFQAKIKIYANKLKPYKSYIDLNPLDAEAEILNYLYKDKFTYGIGHNCSVIWNNNNIETTFLPQYDVKDTKNNFSENDFIDNPDNFKTLNQNLDLYNLSHFSNINKGKTIEGLRNFVNLYEQWIQEQKLLTSSNKEIEDSIIKNLDHNLNRLKSNINLLENDTTFRAFKLANSAMLIQIILSNDNDFSGKEKDLSELNPKINYQDIEYFKNYNFSRLSIDRPKYRPFQLAFLLLNINSITDINSSERNKIVDLIWFPTGGGKTEAYLSVAAFTIIYRRLNNELGFEGTSVIMRYTLRLLTAQQFERTSKLIVALEFLRVHFLTELKNEPITIGMWVGMSSTPNTLQNAEEKVEEINQECNKKNGDPENYNVFQISSCPWCGTKLITKNSHGKWIYGFKIIGKGKNKEFKIKCLNENCAFHNELPVQIVDEMLYAKPPTLLFGTVDKFAMLAWKEDGHKFFNSHNENGLPPDLIIQDELHLLTGPLGSITGLFESVIEILCTKNGRKPKILSSTATTRNTSQQIKALYGKNREVNIFPPPGLSYDDSFFAKVSKAESKRRYLGIIPTGKSSIDTQLQILAHLFVARLEVYKTIILNGKNDYNTFDKYWTIVSYYNSLKDVGKIHNKVGDEISNFTSALQNKLFGDNFADKFNYMYLYNRDKELTGRINSSKIKQTLKSLEENDFNENTIMKLSNGNTYVESSIIDLVLATNMISVGIDIDRLNLMLINGQPKNVAEYIQASSRVGRKYKGLVIGLLDANRARDKSYFEHFIPFHQAFYKNVEPLSLTPFTENTLEKMLASILITYIRHKIPGMASNNSAQYFLPEMLDGLKTEIKERFEEHSNIWLLFESKLQELSDDWLDKIQRHNLKYYDHKTEIHLLVRPAENKIDNKELWSVMQSMREIDTNSFIKIELPKRERNG